MWAIEASPSPKVAYRGGGIILIPAILLLYIVLQARQLIYTDEWRLRKIGHAVRKQVTL